VENGKLQTVFVYIKKHSHDNQARRRHPTSTIDQNGLPVHNLPQRAVYQGRLCSVSSQLGSTNAQRSTTIPVQGGNRAVDGLRGSLAGKPESVHRFSKMRRIVPFRFKTNHPWMNGVRKRQSKRRSFAALARGPSELQLPAGNYTFAFVHESSVSRIFR